MKAGAIILFRGTDAKSRLGRARGGPLKNEDRIDLLCALLLDTGNVLSSSQAFSEVRVGVGTQEAANFVSQVGLKPLILQGADVNSQIKSASMYFLGRAEGYLLIATDLPLLSGDFVEEIVQAAQHLYRSYGRGVVFGASKGLGSASIFLVPPNVTQIVLGQGPTLVVNVERVRQARIPYAVLLKIAGYFDIDTPSHLEEFLYLVNCSESLQQKMTGRWALKHKAQINNLLQRRKH